MIVFVSKNKADYRTLRQVAGLVSQSVVCSHDVRQARKTMHWRHPEIVVCETSSSDSGNWQELLEDADAAHSVVVVASRHADERLWAEVLNLGGFDVLSLPFDCDELLRSLSAALRHSPRALAASATA